MKEREDRTPTEAEEAVVHNSSTNEDIKVSDNTAIPVEYLVEEGSNGWWLMKHEKPKIYYSLERPSLYECPKCGHRFHVEGKIDRNALFRKKIRYVDPVSCSPESEGGCGRTTYPLRIVPPPLETSFWAEIPAEYIKKTIGQADGVYVHRVLDGDIRKLYDEILNLTKKFIVFKSEVEYKIYTLWNIATWKYDEFYTVPYLGFMGEIESGKTRALEGVEQFGYHAMGASNVSVASVPRAIESLRATLLVDEVHHQILNGTDKANELLGIFKSGYKRGMKYTVCDDDDKNKVIGRDVFGFKAFATTKSFHPDLHSRSIIFWMEEAEPEIKDMREIFDDARRIRGMLCAYRYLVDAPPNLDLAKIPLKGRILEIFEPILRIALQFGLPIDDIIAYSSLQRRQQRENLYNSIEALILQVIYREHITYKERKISLKVIASEVFPEDRRGAQKIGYRLRDMGIPTKRIAIGTIVNFTNSDVTEKLAYLYKKYNTAELSKLGGESWEDEERRGEKELDYYGGGVK